MNNLFKSMPVWLFVSATLAAATTVQISLPTESAVLKTSALPGYAVALRQCMTCHSVDYINFQPPDMGLKQWTAEVAKMQHQYGAPLTDQDVALVGAYLAVAYGSAKEADLPPGLRGQSEPTASAPGSVIDVQSLLSANGCLGCHAVDKKIVGPSYREVAAKYRGATVAAGLLQESIRRGSQGKWGSAAMPPFSQLAPDEIRALAEFVLDH